MEFNDCFRSKDLEQNMPDREVDSADNAEETRRQREALEIQNALRGLRFGSINVIVQDGIVVQIDRTEKKRIVKPKTTR